MRNKYIFDIPIYRKTKTEFNSEIETQVAKRIERIISYDPEQRPLSQDVRQRQYHSVIAESGGPWQFNQIVGWFRLFVEGKTIGCHPWWVDAKRLNRKMRNKRLYLQTYSDVLQERITNESSNEIFNRLLERLIKLSKERMYKNRYIDLDVFQRIGPFINWRKLMYSLPEQQ
jgi:hypothetical protein